jgi:hypothetical protein
LSTAYNIKLNGKSVSREQLIKYIKALGLGPEYIGSIVVKDGMATVGNDITTQGDLTTANTDGRHAHIHNHPPIALDLTFNFKYFDPKGNERIGESLTKLPIPNSGVDAPDQTQAHRSLRSVVVDGARIYLYNGDWGQTIRFNRLTRGYEQPH